MNQVNPLHVGGLLLMLLVYAVFHLSGLKSELVEVESAYKESEKLAVDLSSLKNVYANKIKTKSSIDRILAQTILSSAQLSVKKAKDSITITSISIDTKALNFFMSKILNGSYNISRIKVKRLSDTKASLDLEIKW